MVKGRRRPEAKSTSWLVSHFVKGQDPFHGTVHLLPHHHPLCQMAEAIPFWVIQGAKNCKRITSWLTCNQSADWTFRRSRHISLQAQLLQASFSRWVSDILSSPEQQNKNRSPLSPWLSGHMNFCLNGGKHKEHPWSLSLVASQSLLAVTPALVALVNFWGAVWLHTQRCYKHHADLTWHLESATSVTNRNTPICSVLNSSFILNTSCKGVSNKIYPIYCCNLDYHDWN